MAATTRCAKSDTTGEGVGPGTEGLAAGARKDKSAATTSSNSTDLISGLRFASHSRRRGVEVTFAPLCERRLERVLRRHNQLGVRLEVDPALLPHAPVVASPRGLKDAAAAISEAIARIGVA